MVLIHTSRKSSHLNSLDATVGGCMHDVDKVFAWAADYRDNTDSGASLGETAPPPPFTALPSSAPPI
jgi:hypothetical protein